MQWGDAGASGHACGPALATAVADKAFRRSSATLLLLPLTDPSEARDSPAPRPCRKAKLPYSCLVHNEGGNLCFLCYNSAFQFLAFAKEANFVWLAVIFHFASLLPAP